MAVECPACGCYEPAHRISCERLMNGAVDFGDNMGPDDALNSYIRGQCPWSQVVKTLEESKLLLPSALDYLYEISTRMPTDKQTERYDAVEALLRVWPLAKNFGWHAGLIVMMQHPDSTVTKVV